MKICYSSRSYALYSWEYFEKQQKALNVECVELFGGTPHIWVDHMGYVIPEELRNSTLNLVMYTPKPYNYSLCAVDPDQKQKTAAYYRNCVNAAAELGVSDMTVTFSGGLLDAPDEQKHENAVNQLIELASYAADCNMNIHIAPNGSPKESEAFDLESVCRIMNEVSGENIFVLLDTSAMEGRGETAAQWSQKLGDRIRGVRIRGTGVPLDKHVDDIRQIGPIETFYLELDDDDYWDSPDKWEASSLEHIRSVTKEIIT